MRQQGKAGAGGVTVILLAAALLAAPVDADARGGRRGGSGIGKAMARADSRADSGSGTHLTIRPNFTSSRDGSGAETGDAPAGRVRAALPGAGGGAVDDAEEQARRAAALASYEKAATEREAARKAEAESAAALRQAAEKLEAQLAAQQAAEERAEAGRQAAVLDQQKRELALRDAEVQQVLERAKTDHPVLRTAEGEPILRAILERQKVLQARGLYPSIAMVEAVADHTGALRPRARAEPAPEPQAAPDYSKTYGSCRWVTPYTWSCK